jgi:2-keto-4-pentenoate hydratase/2-oxohepta-3-ene-1,7-dioic acid hydratase in catechol pathway
MRLVTYRDRGGVVRAGALVDRDGVDHVVDLSALGAGGAGLLGLLETGEGWLDRTLRDVGEASSADGAPVPLDDVELLAPIPRPPKLLAAAANYQAHITEAGLPEVDRSRIVPKLFMKPSSAVIAPGEALRLPSISDDVDWELELGVIVGSRARDVAVEHALEAVAGYTIVNDVSARSIDWGLADREPNDWNGFFDWLNGKWLDGFAPMGPWLLTADEVPDPGNLEIELRVNGVVRQAGPTGAMIFGVAELVSFASRLMTLEPGDVIATGTPAGVGATTGDRLRDGDVMEGTITGLGVLRTPVVGP